MAKNTRKPKAEDFDVEISTTSNADLTLEDIELDLDTIEDAEEVINEEGARRSRRRCTKTKKD